MPLPWIIRAQLGSDGCVLATPYSTNKDRDQRHKEIAPMSPALGAARCCLSPVCAEGFQNDDPGPGRTGQAPEPILSHFTASLWKTGSGPGQVPRAAPVHAQDPCTGSLLICKLQPFGLASLWGSSLEASSWSSQSKDCLSSSSSLGVLLENPRSERWLSRWHSASTGNQHLPKGEPCPCSPSNSPAGPAAMGQPRGVSLAAPSRLLLLAPYLGISSGSSSWGQHPSVLEEPS